MNDFVCDQYLSHRVELASMFSMDMIGLPSQRSCLCQFSEYVPRRLAPGLILSFLAFHPLKLSQGKEKGDTNPGSTRY